MSIESHVLHISILTRPFKSTKSELRILVYSVGISEEEHELPKLLLPYLSIVYPLSSARQSRLHERSTDSAISQQ